MKFCNKMLAFREEQRTQYVAGCACGKTLGDFTTVNLTSLQAGVTRPDAPVPAFNVVPSSAEAGAWVQQSSLGLTGL